MLRKIQQCNCYKAATRLHHTDSAPSQLLDNEHRPDNSAWVQLYGSCIVAEWSTLISIIGHFGPDDRSVRPAPLRQFGAKGRQFHWARNAIATHLRFFAKKYTTCDISQLTVFIIVYPLMKHIKTVEHWTTRLTSLLLISTVFVA